MPSSYGVIDLFAGPGGLGEGFSSLRDSLGQRVFDIHLSAEMDAAAHATLKLRAFLRNFDGEVPEKYLRYHAGLESEVEWADVNGSAWSDAGREACRIELGTDLATQVVDKAITEVRKRWGDRTVVIGGPPCQAYSLVGRARNQAIAGYEPLKDKRHFLFREYLRVLSALKPAVFVMENVKGLLSSRVGEDRIFDLLMEDLSSLGGERDLYKLVPLSPSSIGENLINLWDAEDYLIQAEDHGIPQARHRVILLGVRRDVAQGLRLKGALLGEKQSPVAANMVLSGLSRLRSGLSRTQDTPDAWRDEVIRQIEQAVRASEAEDDLADIVEPLVDFGDLFRRKNEMLSRSSTEPAAVHADCPPDLANWICDKQLLGTANHETRAHMASDLARYYFASVFAWVRGVSPKASDFPDGLMPAHRNWKSGKFADRFRVQLADRPSTTVTSHISKDGHYFIHPDPSQCRSLSVREAARLQTFPDNYLFLGPRTEQYKQVGNAVPPLLANRIAGVVHAILENSLTELTDAPRERVAVAR